MGEHIDNRKHGFKKHKKGLSEGVDKAARLRRVTFKSYLREIEEELLEDDLDILDETIDESEDELDK